MSSSSRSPRPGLCATTLRALAVRVAVGCAAALLPAAASAEITVFDEPEFGGEARIIDRDVPDLRDAGWNDRISSIRLGPGAWEVCRGVDYRDCRVLRSDDRDLKLTGWNDSISSLRPLGGSGAGLTTFEDFDYHGGARNIDGDLQDLRSIGWNDKISSFRIGSGIWELCREIDFHDCQTFRADERELGRLRGWNETISSLRRIDSDLPLIEVFENFDYAGSSRTFERAVSELQREDWNDRISSLRVISGRWQLCRHNDYRECREIGGSERELPSDWDDTISSIRPLRPFSNE